MVDYHSFLRCHVDDQGTLTVYPIAVDRIPRRWRARTRVDDPDYEEKSLPELVPPEEALRARLIEPAIEIRHP